MDTQQDKNDTTEQLNLEDDKTIEQALQQMEVHI